MYRELVNRGHEVNHKRVQRIMHQMNLAEKRPKEKYHSYKGEIGKAADNVIDRDFTAARPLEKWTADVSQFSFPWGKCYLSPILDMYSNEIISYSLSQSPNMKQITDMLQKAFERFPKLNGLILHSDQGWQYQHTSYRDELRSHGIVQSMSRKGNCYDNCIMETFFGRLKNERNTFRMYYHSPAGTAVYSSLTFHGRRHPPPHQASSEDPRRKSSFPVSGAKIAAKNTGDFVSCAIALHEAAAVK